MRDEILKAFTARYPSIKPYQAERCVDRYIQVTLREIAYSIANFGVVDGEFALSVSQMREDIGKLLLEGKQQWITNLMHVNPRTSLITINFKGNKGKTSRVSLNPIYEKQIMDQLINLNYELNAKRVNELKEQANLMIAVEPDSLDEYITKTVERYVEVEHDPKMHVYREALARNLMIAHQIKDQIVTQNGEYFLPEYWEETDSGRIYGHGLSLQRIPKQVRHAALGICHQYDFKASSFGMMAGLAQQIKPDIKIADLTDYIKNRATIRKRIAAEIGITENRVKDIFTSLGFGASTADNPYTSIRGKLSSEQYEALMANKQFKYIREAMERVRATIAEHFKSDDFEFLGRKYNPIDPKSDQAKKRTKNQKLAWIYQVMESEAITKFGSLATEAGYQPILFAHDCLYFKHKPSPDTINNIMYLLNKEYPLLRVEHQEVIPIFAKKPGNSALIEYDQMVESHKAFIDAEEMAQQSEKKFDPLDPVHGYFAAEIAALNQRVNQSMGTAINLPH